MVVTFRQKFTENHFYVGDVKAIYEAYIGEELIYYKLILKNDTVKHISASMFELVNPIDNQTEGERQCTNT